MSIIKNTEELNNLLDAVQKLPVKKDEQEKVVDITENGTTVVTPDEGMTLGEVTVNVEVESGGGGTEEIENIIDQSGVLGTTDETVTVMEKVEQLIDKANVKGIILSDFTDIGFPKKADMRSIDIPEQEITANRSTTFTYLFANLSSQGFYCALVEIYLPERIHAFSSYMFQNCYNLTTLHGDTTGVKSVADYAFQGCKKLTKFPYMPSLLVLSRSAFNGCTGLTEVKIYNKLTECAAAAFYSCTNIKDIYVPWAEGEVANAPWGATNATIHYNTTYDENGNPIEVEV